jgi:hypothetical protein
MTEAEAAEQALEQAEAQLNVLAEWAPEAYEAALAAIEQYGVDTDTGSDFSRVPAAVVQTLDPAIWAALISHAHALNHYEASDEPAVEEQLATSEARRAGEERLTQAAQPSCYQFWRHSGHTARVRWYHCHATSSAYTKRVHICGYSGILHGISVASLPGGTWLRARHRHDPGGEGCTPR